ncbi:MAG: lysine--tRNA ligase, partial [Bacteroidota bacterium]
MDHDPEILDVNELMKRRKEEHDLLRAQGINPYPYSFDRSARSKEVIDSFRDGEPEQIVTIAGRIMSLRRMGKA